MKFNNGGFLWLTKSMIPVSVAVPVRENALLTVSKRERLMSSMLLPVLTAELVLQYVR